MAPAKLILILLLATASSLFAQEDIALVAANQSAPAAGGGGVTYLVDEGFEGTGAPADWSTEGGSFDPDWDYTGTVIDGAQSLSTITSGSGAQYSSTAEMNEAELWGRFKVRFTADASQYFFRILPSGGGAALASLYRQVGGGLMVVSGGGGFPTTVATTANDTTYYVWWHYVKGTGANSTMEVWFSTTSTKPSNGSNNHAVESNGTAAANAARIAFTHSNQPGIYDDVKVAAEAFE